MKKILSSKLNLLFLLLLLFSCVPNKEVSYLGKEELKKIKHVTTPTKVFISDASIILFQDGFFVNDDTVTGNGERTFKNGNVKVGSFEILLKDIEAMTYHNAKFNGGTATGSFLTIATGIPLSALSVYCIVCPKCCFGSCPTVYIQDNGEYKLVAELFSYSISKILEEKDLDFIKGNHTSDNFELRVTNEALETHYIDNLSLLTVKYPKDKKLLQTDEDSFSLISEEHTPYKMTNRSNEDVSSMLKSKDDKTYRSDEDLVYELAKGPYFDWIDINVKIPDNTENVKLIVKYKNTLLSTVLFYDVVLASQGIDAVTWTEKMNNDESYANFFRSVYDLFSGIKIKQKIDDNWKKIGQFGDAGPMNYKNLVKEIPVKSGETEMDIRLEFIPDNFFIDYIAVDFSDDYHDDENSSIEVNEIKYSSVINNLGDKVEKIENLLKSDDDNFLVTNPGDSYRFYYNLGKVEEDISSNNNRAIFLKSKGFYTEWIRGDWVKVQPPEDKFNIFKVNETFQKLADSWLNNKQMLEDVYFETKIPVMEEKCLKN